VCLNGKRKRALKKEGKNDDQLSHFSLVYGTHVSFDIHERVSSFFLSNIVFSHGLTCDFQFGDNYVEITDYDVSLEF
jgi:hypothetical protein